jgi:hypothetical protein
LAGQKFYLDLVPHALSIGSTSERVSYSKALIEQKGIGFQRIIAGDES